MHHPYNSRSFSAWQCFMLFKISCLYSFRMKRSIQLVTAKLKKYIFSLSANLYFLLIYKYKKGFINISIFIHRHRYANAPLPMLHICASGIALVVCSNFFLYTHSFSKQSKHAQHLKYLNLHYIRPSFQSNNIKQIHPRSHSRNGQ